MRTSRVESTPSSIFRNARQYLQANELFARALHEGLEQGFTGGQQQSTPKRRKRKEKVERRRNVVLKRNAGSFITRGFHYDATTIASMQNRLLKRSKKIMNAQKSMNSLRAYQTSI